MPVSIESKRALVNSILQVSYLTNREKDILKMRLGMNEYPCCTLQYIGKKYGISRERVRQIGVSISNRIKKNLPEKAFIADNIFTKAWIPKYLSKNTKIGRIKNYRVEKTIPILKKDTTGQDQI